MAPCKEPRAFGAGCQSPGLMGMVRVARIVLHLGCRPALLLLLLPAVVVPAQEVGPETGVRDGGPEWYHERAREAIEAENYQTAVQVLQEGQRRHPASASLNTLLADLYYDKELYSLALEEYREAARKQGEDFTVLHQIARCYGRLNREQDSIATLERVLELYPESVYTADDLGWMYFKTHQLEKAESLLLEALGRFGPERGLYMTLGTIYSGMYEYQRSRRFYLLAIEDALDEQDEYFASVAHYNLSLLEHSFYRFNSALRHTEESIRLSDRAPGHLARGELFESRLDYPLALEEYEQALARDTSPLSKVNLASLYQRFGFLELARRYAEEVLTARDRAWLYYFGTDVARHLKDVHEILWKTHRGLAQAELRKPSGGPLERLGMMLRSLPRWVSAYQHRQKYRYLCLQVGRSYREEGNLLDAYWELFKAGEGYPRVALKYLRLARDRETALSPRALPYYLLEEGRLLGERLLLEQAIESFDAFWEREGIHEALAALVTLLPRRSIERRHALNRLFALNPGALPQRGLRLPVSVELPRGGRRGLGGVVRKLASAVRVTSGTTQEGVRYSMSMQWESSRVVMVRLFDRETGEPVFQGPFVAGRRLWGRRAAALARSIAERLYAVP